MGAETTISISFLLSIISCIGVIVAIVNTIKKGSEKEQQKELEIEKQFVKINVKLDNFCDSVNTILKNHEKSNDEIRILSEKIIKDDERIETLFKYHDNHEKRITNLENQK